ncbi:MAG TPA: enoyl-CoA hydratase/isomerase family protein [Solirubrobacterales bacterium]|nr:enoyl-CoA hydratase/isomerase family protein [Solirubrobacterales bacterium]
MTSDTVAPPQLNTLRIEIDGEIGTLTLDRPDAFNAMSPEMIGELIVAFGWLADRAKLRGLIVTGSGKAFCAGGDVTWFRKGVESDEIDLPSDVRRGAEALHQAIIDLRRIPFPVVAAINGPAAGAGFSLALACDMRISSSAAFFAPAYGRIGASPDGGMTYFLPRVVGPSKALEILLEDPNMSAADAKELGLVREVVEPDELMASARALADELAKKAPHYVRMAKKLVGVSIENSINDHLQLERHGIADSMATEDLRNGVETFFSGGTPEFHGR